MKKLIEAVRTYLLANATVASLITSARFTAEVIPQAATLPAADIRVSSTSHEHLLNSLAGLATSTVTIDCYGNTVAQADALAEAMILSGIVGLKTTVATVHIRGVRLVSGPAQDTETVEPGTDKWRYVTWFTLEIDYSFGC